MISAGIQKIAEPDLRQLPFSYCDNAPVPMGLFIPSICLHN
jgi:hypothetical protein